MEQNPTLRRFYENELESYRENVRNGNIDPSDGFHPTLASALDSLQQAPEDYRRDWLGLGDVDSFSPSGAPTVEQIDNAVDICLALAARIAQHGPEAKLVDFV